MSLFETANKCKKNSAKHRSSSSNGNFPIIISDKWPTQFVSRMIRHEDETYDSQDGYMTVRKVIHSDALNE